LWNRTAAAGLDAYARAHPGRARSVALAEALALGRSERLTADLRESYRRGGIYHLLVFSGMQIAIAAAFLSLILRGFGAPRAADLMLLLLSLTAPPFAGHEASVSRASWMLGLYAASRLMQRPTPAANLLFVSAMIRLTLVPTELSNAGFLLTYAATGGLVLFGPALAALFARRKFLLALAAGLGAEIATTGLVLFFFHQYVIGSSLVTIALSPLVTAMLALSASAALAVVFCPAATGLCLEALSRLDGLIAMATDLIANRLGLFGFAPRPHLFVLLAAWIASLLLFAISRSRQTRIAAVLLLLVPVADSLVLARTRAHIRGPQLEMLDVGQGDSMLLRTSTGSMLVDGGGKAGDDDFGRRVLLPMLAERAVRSIDVIALSHPDGDHCGGLPGVVAAIPVHEIWISRRHLDSLCGQRLLDLASNRHILVLLMPATPEMRRIGLRIEPLVPRLTFKHSPVNNSSVVYRITAAGTRVLLTGDIEKDAETLLADEERETISADILKVAHHGSRTSSSEGFIDAVRPRIALISCGFRNPFGHPGAVTLSRLRQHHAVTYRTDRNGAILLRLGEWPTPVETESQRIP
ncbi:MAG: DNA internalization-related competence protein ComEC/Rec2, partial [Acidobacteriota bacterium]